MSLTIVREDRPDQIQVTRDKEIVSVGDELTRCITYIDEQGHKVELAYTVYLVGEVLDINGDDEEVYLTNEDAELPLYAPIYLGVDTKEYPDGQEFVSHYVRGVVRKKITTSYGEVCKNINRFRPENNDPATAEEVNNILRDILEADEWYKAR